MTSRRAIVALLSVGLLLAACTGDDGGGGGTDGPPEQTAEAGTMRLALGTPLVADPAAASLASSTDQMVLDLLHDGLTRLDADGVPQPALAQRWVAGERRDSWRFKLRSDATFSDGSPLTAADVVASLEHVASAGDGSLAALALEPIKGFRAFVDGDAEHLSGLKAVDDTTLTIATTGPFSVLPVLLASPELGVVRPAEVEGVDGVDDLAELPLSGAWQVEEAGDGGAVLTPRTEGGGVTSIELREHDDEDEAYDAFADGDADWAAVPASRYGDAVDAYGDGAFAPFQAELFFGLNLAARDLRSAELRKAIALAIDRDAIIEAVYADLADPLVTVVPAGVPGHDGERCRVCAQDLEAAEALVEEAYPDGDVPEIRIDYDESPAQSAMAEVIAENLDAVGIPTKLHPLPLEEYKRFVVSGDQELFSFGWIGAFTSPDAYLSRLFQTSSDDNLTSTSSPAIDLLLAGARRSADPAAQLEAWAAAEEEVNKEYAVVPIAQFRTQVVVSDRVTGWAHAVDGSVDWSLVSVDG